VSGFIIIIINIFNVAKIMLIIARTTGVQAVVRCKKILTLETVIDLVNFFVADI